MSEVQPAEAEPDRGMDDSELASLLAGHEARAVGYYNSEIADEQAKAINYYYGIMDDVPVLDGCSAVVDHTVAVMVDNGLAAVLKPFVSADEVVSFDPRGPEDQGQAEQATEYVNYVINCDNPGFLVFHDWFKDALLTKIGVVKVWWEDQTKAVTTKHPVDAVGLLAAREHPGYQGEEEAGDGVYHVHISQDDPDGRVRIENVPPEEFLISPFARSIEAAPYVAHRPTNYTRSDLIELGVDAEIADTLPAYGQGRAEESRSQARYRDEQWFTGTHEAIGSDRSRDVIGVLDEYVRCDYDGDGIAELRRVIRVNDVILFNETVEEAPFALICPVPMPHKVYGRSTADQAMEGQKVSTAVLRQTLDNLYKTNNPRPEVPDTAVNDSTWDDIGDTAPGAAIRTKVPGQLQFFEVPFTAAQSFPMLEYIALQTEERTGIQRKGNGLNPEALKKHSPDTATQASIEENSQNERAEMIARIFAETGVKRLFKLILKLLVAHQPKERLIRLRNQWVPIDPRGWSPDMDLTISVGLGVGNKMEQIQQADAVLGTMAELQQTPYAYLIDASKVHNALKRKFTAAGIKNVDDYLVDPATTQPPPPQPDPNMAKVQGELQMQAAKLQADQQTAAMKAQLSQAEAEHKANMAQAETAARVQIEQTKAQTAAAIEQAKAQFEAQLAQQKAAQEFELKKIELEMNRQIQAERAANDHEAKMSKNRDGGDLSK